MSGLRGRFLGATGLRDHGAEGDDGIRDPGRRIFVMRAIAAISGLIAAAVAVPVAGFATAAGWRASSPLRLLGRSIPPTLQSDGWVSVGVLDDFEVGVPKRVITTRRVSDGWITEDAPVGAFIFRRAARVVVAYDIHCTHLGCPLQYVEGARSFLCPCHGGQFNRDGNVVGGPPPRALTHFATKLEGDEVFLGALEAAAE
jgi:menaquinol-cytochrome c reductase iron-sulfur subunit